ncbi:acylphosphatase [Alteribacter populi]|uniref:acylphosphatase n=1 Tax=Alteribacter populi TaxID=2011011 RepID=UPI000BBB4B63|nr:acylphosphatase [Alteribacter populi]
MKRIQGIVSGKVQGVGFRNFTQQTAAEENMKGWVRNLPDGTVEFEAEGDEKAVETFVKRLKKGQFPAKVEAIVTNNIQVLNEEKDFRVRP